ncbi:hypothetical protein Pla175_11190 [Pirellulimonas nuda]|uniref:Uncharacterized protein n=1 Tax=Pirellulimonas nuda TaxID=2528009 RepID=A0A518D8G5_9BACT|nr:hypothetical protein [Pirellulimonas nuda]QDU87753.1 hypothetical protein Pla175_11190 [Pirellulimonas nuda]
MATEFRRRSISGIGVLLAIFTFTQKSVGLDATGDWRLIDRVQLPPGVEPFGTRVAVHSGGLLASGFYTSPYSTRVFHTTVGSLSPPVELLPTSPPERSFFWYPAISADRILIGDDEEGSPTPGAAYLFDRATNAPIAKLTAPDGVIGRDFWFGQDVALTPDYAVVQAIAFQNPGVYLFDAADGGFVRKIDAPDGVQSIDANQDFVLTGGAATDKAQLYDIATGELLAEFENPNPIPLSPQFGSEVALGDGFAAILAPLPQGGGSVSVFRLDTHELVYTLAMGSSTAGSMDADGRFLIVNGTIYDLPTGRIEATLPYSTAVAIQGNLAMIGVSVYQRVPEPCGLVGVLLALTATMSAAGPRLSRGPALSPTHPAASPCG